MFVQLLVQYAHLWNSGNIIEILNILIARREVQFMEKIINLPVISQIMENASVSGRNEFAELMEQISEGSFS